MFTTKKMTAQDAHRLQEELRQYLESGQEAEAWFLCCRGNWFHWVPSVWYLPWTWNLRWGQWRIKEGIG